MGDLIAGIIKGLAHLLKVIFGTGKPRQQTERDAPSRTGRPSRADVLDDLGVRADAGTNGGDEDGDSPTR